MAKGMEKGMEKGRAEGRAEGEKEKALEIARNLKSLRVPPADIAKATGLAEEEIERL